MTKHPAALAFALAFATTAALPGCDRTASLTEQEHIQRAQDLEDQGKLREGIIELKNALQKNPNSAQARLLLGQIYLKAGSGAEAEKELRLARKLGVNAESIMPQLGEALLLMGEYTRLLDEIQPSDQLSKVNRARILQLRGDALLGQGKRTEACGLFQWSLDAHTQNPPTYWGLARCALAERDTAKARSWLDAALKIPSRQAQTWTFIGDLEQLDDNPQAALAAYTEALKSDPNHLEALLNRAALNMALGHLEPARADVRRVGELAPKSVSAHYLRALLNFEQKKYPEARDALQAVFVITSEHMPSVLLAGATAYALGSYQQAESHLKRFLARYPGHGYARRVLAATLVRQKQLDKALETLAPLTQSDSKDALALALASEVRLMMHEPAMASTLLEKAVLIDPKNAAIHTQLALSRLVSGDSQLAVTELQAAASMDADQYRADTLLVLAHLKRKEYDKALAAIANMEKKLPRSPITHSLRGETYLGKNDLPNARKSFEAALAIDPAFFPAAASLAWLDVRDRNPQAAQKRFENILNKDKNNLQAMMALAELAAASNREKDHIAWLNKAANAHPDAIPPRAALVKHHLGKKETARALAIANEVANSYPDSPAALNLLGATQMDAGKPSDAIITFTQLTKKAPDSPDALLRLALAQVAHKQPAAARSTLKKALQLKPGHLQSLDALLRLELAEKHPEAALQIARQIQLQHPQSPRGYSREGDILLSQKALPQAVKAYEQAMEKGDGTAGFIKLHRAYILAGNAAAADQRLNDWLKRHPEDWGVRSYAAEYFTFAGRNQEAIAQYQAILQRSPDSAAVLNNLANLYLRTQDTRALATAERALKFAPDSPAVQDTLGWILLEQGQTGRGLELLSKAAANAPGIASIRYHHAVALARSGDKASARKILERLLAEIPKFPEAEAARTLLNKL